jgi:hypothetical protein
VAIAIEHQVGEQQRHLPAAQALDQLHSVQLHGQTPTELNPGSFASAPAGNVLETY